MAKYDALIEINVEKVENLSDYISFCKYYFKPKSEAKVENYLYKKGKKILSIDKYKLDSIKKDFPFILSNKEYKEELENNKIDGELFKFFKDNKSNQTLKDFPLTWIKEEIMQNGNKKSISIEDEQIKNLHSVSGIFTEESQLKAYIEKLPKYSFVIWSKFTLDAPYFSKDDDEYYIIQNPILKEKAFKVPMIRGSGWKGALASAFKDLINENNDKTNTVDSYLRIFGAGSESIKNIESYLKENSKSLEDFKDNIISFILFELGMRVDKDLLDKIRNEKSYEKLIDILKSKISEKLQKTNPLPMEFQTHKGRAIFYPTYFNTLSLEIINPHDRRKRAGTGPIHYEVVPKGTEGTLQIVYIPFDGILKSDSELQEEAKQDLENLCKALEKLQEKGIGAKTKLGWGRFKLNNPSHYCKDNSI